MTNPLTPDEESDRLDIIRDYLDTEGPGQELSFADQIASAEARGTRQDRELVAEVRTELEDFLGEPAKNYESVAAMVDEADHRLTDAVYGEPSNNDEARSDEYDDLHQHAQEGLGSGLAH